MVRAFLEEEFPLVFGLRLADLSLSSLVKSEEVRSLLMQGEEAIRSVRFDHAVEFAARAFRLSAARYAAESEQLIGPGVRLSPFLGIPSVGGIDDYGLPFWTNMDRDVTEALHKSRGHFANR